MAIADLNGQRCFVDGQGEESLMNPVKRDASDLILLDTLAGVAMGMAAPPRHPEPSAKHAQSTLPPRERNKRKKRNKMARASRKRNRK